MGDLVIDFHPVHNEVALVALEPEGESVAAQGGGADEDLADLLISDPLAYEQRVLEGR